MQIFWNIWCHLGNRCVIVYGKKIRAFTCKPTKIEAFSATRQDQTNENFCKFCKYTMNQNMNFTGCRWHINHSMLHKNAVLLLKVIFGSKINCSIRRWSDKTPWYIVFLGIFEAAKEVLLREAKMNSLRSEKIDGHFSSNAATKIFSTLLHCSKTCSSAFWNSRNSWTRRKHLQVRR